MPEFKTFNPGFRVRLFLSQLKLILIILHSLWKMSDQTFVMLDFTPNERMSACLIRVIYLFMSMSKILHTHADILIIQTGRSNPGSRDSSKIEIFNDN